MERLIVLIACLLLLAGCASGPGSDCDPCATGELAPMPGGNAAAAAARGGQTANQAPFSGESGFTPTTKVTVGRGAGATTSSSADRAERHTSSGGAQNLALLVPTKAEAHAGGGTSASVVSAQQVVTSYLAALQLAMAQGADPEHIRFLSEQVAKAQQALATAEAGTRANVTNNYNMGGDNTIVGYSRAGTGVGKDDPKAMEVLNDAAKAVLAKPSSTDALDVPPAEPETPDPAPGGGGGP